jgi:hypothetical protein
MVVLETASPTSAVGLLDPLDSYSNRSSMKLLPKRFINVHQWLGPICAKQLKETLVSRILGFDYGGCDAYRFPGCGSLRVSLEPTFWEERIAFLFTLEREWYAFLRNVSSNKMYTAPQIRRHPSQILAGSITPMLIMRCSYKWRKQASVTRRDVRVRSLWSIFMMPARFIQYCSGCIIIIYCNCKWASTGGNGPRVEHNTQVTHLIQNSTPVKNKTQHAKLRKQ